MNPRTAATPSRRELLGLLLAMPLAWTACSTPPPPSPPTAPSRQVTLRALGFAPVDVGWQLDLGGRIVFSLNDATLAPEALTTLAHVAQALLGVGIERVTVEGHTDNQGNEDNNRRLSERRAEVVAQALVKQGFVMGNIVRRGYSSARPIADNSKEAGRLQNRRAVLIVSSV